MDVEVLTYGCAMNQADSEIIHGLLEARGHRIIPEDGDVVVVNTCVVKLPTENKILKQLRELDAAGRRVVVAGCMPPTLSDLKEKFPGFSLIGVNVFDIVDAVEAAYNSEVFVKVEGHPSDKVCQPKKRVNPVVEIVPVAEGCLGQCSYCITKLARGNLKSYPISKIVDQVCSAISSVVKEIWLTGQDTGAYGLDVRSSLPELLDRVTALEGDFRVRVGMMNPDHALQQLDKLVSAYENEKIYKFLHLPVQSGCDRILGDMKRGYKVDDFKQVVNTFRKSFKEFTLSTDVIVGYPTESETEFQETVSLVKEVKPDVLNVSRYWLRPGTKASELKQHPGRVTKARSRVMGKVFQEVGLQQNREWIGWRGKALVSEPGTARNQAYRPIIVDESIPLGNWVDVGVRDATYYDLRT